MENPKKYLSWEEAKILLIDMIGKCALDNMSVVRLYRLHDLNGSDLMKEFALTAVYNDGIRTLATELISQLEQDDDGGAEDGQVSP